MSEKQNESKESREAIESIRTNPQLVQYVLDEFNSMKDKKEKREMRKILLGYMLQRLVIREKLDSKDKNDLKRMEDFQKMAKTFMEKDNEQILERIYSLSRQGYVETGNELNSVYQDIYGKFTEMYGEKDEFQKDVLEIELRGRKVEEMARDTEMGIAKAIKDAEAQKAPKRADGENGG